MLVELIIGRMGRVTNILLSFSLAEANRDGLEPQSARHWPIVDQINDFLVTHGHATLTRIDTLVGGEEQWVGNLYGGAFDDISVLGLWQYLRGLPWKDRESVTVLYKHDDEQWSIAHLWLPVNESR